MNKQILVVGAGSIGERHLRCFQVTGRAKVSFCEANPSLRRNISERYEVRGFDDYESALGADAFDGVVICTPAHLHVPMARLALTRRLPALIEKPLSVSMEGVMELERAYRESGVYSAVAYIHHSNPIVQKARELLIAGEIGKPLQVAVNAGQHFPTARPGYRDIYYARHEHGGGAIQDALTHLVNLVEWLLYPCSSVFCEAGHFALEGVTVEDTVALAARHDEIIAVYSLNQFQAPDETTIGIHGTKGSLEIRLHLNEVRLFARGARKWKTFAFPTIPRDQTFIWQAESFLDALDGRPSPLLSTLAEAAQTLRVSRAALESARTGKKIEIGPQPRPGAAITHWENHESPRHNGTIPRSEGDLLAKK